MKKHILTLPICLFSVLCFSQRKIYINETLQTVNNKEVCLNFSEYQNKYDSLNSEFEISKFEILDDCVKLWYSYGGGCGDVYLRMSYRLKSENDLHIMTLLPMFDDNDLCEAFFFDNLCFFSLPKGINGNNLKIEVNAKN